MLKEYKKILVAVDGSHESELAFKKATQVARRNNAVLVIAHIIDIRAFESVSSFDESLAKEAANIARETLDAYITYAKEQGIQHAEYVIEYGSPKVLLAKNLQHEHDIDLILLGATGLNTMERIFIGSVSSYVARNAHCDVLIVRTDLDNRPIPKMKKAKK